MISMPWWRLALFLLIAFNLGFNGRMLCEQRQWAPRSGGWYWIVAVLFILTPFPLLLVLDMIADRLLLALRQRRHA